MLNSNTSNVRFPKLSDIFKLISFTEELRRYLRKKILKKTPKLANGKNF